MIIFNGVKMFDEDIIRIFIEILIGDDRTYSISQE